MFRHLNVCSLCRLKHLPVAAGLGEEDCGSAGWKAELLRLPGKGSGGNAAVHSLASPFCAVFCCSMRLLPKAVTVTRVLCRMSLLLLSPLVGRSEMNAGGHPGLVSQELWLPWLMQSGGGISELCVCWRRGSAVKTPLWPVR